ncbi:MAG TPA: biopolymer transporter ExbD [Negativicutes bacterium]|nr:biopolymer transporter ExbD [Negativicutes bacterium]
MKLRERRIVENPRLMIIPMIDIMFFLLVFFMMSTMFMVEQKVLPVVLPAASAAELDTGRTAPITVMADGSLRFAEDAVSLALLEARARSEMMKDKETRFVLRADRTVAYGKVVEVMNTLRKIGVQRLTVAVEPIQ